MEKYEIKECSCGCKKSYPVGKSKPCDWLRIGNSIQRLSDNTIFSQGDIIQRFTEQGKQYCDMIIERIDFYNHNNDNTFYIRASEIKSNDRKIGITNITDNITDYRSADNPNTLRFIKKIKLCNTN